MNIPVVFEDDWFFVVDKPAGLLTIPSPRNETRTLQSILNDDARERGRAYRLHPCHRLDRETSGLIVFAKGKAAQKQMMELFRRRGVEKRYVAFVHGVLPQVAGTIRTPVEREPAETRYRTLQRRKDFSVVELIAVTGRKNQLRLHLKGIGHPLVGESRFAFRKDFPLRAKRAFLHAQSLSFVHPLTGRNLRLDAALPADMTHFLQKHA